MSQQQNSWQSLIYSSVGLIAMAVLLIAIGVIADALHLRMDMTEEKIYTLSEGTRRILSRIKEPIEIHFYFSRSNPQVPASIKNFAKRVEDLLAEYRRASNGKIIIKKFDPRPDTDAEDAAKLDGIEGRVLSTPGVINLTERIYLGLAVVYLDQKATIPFLDPSRENLLEYDITRAIARVIHPEKPVLGIISGLPIFGQYNPVGGGNQQPWFLIQELEMDYKVRRINTPVEEIDKDINLLLVIHPTNLNDETLFALDQFVLRGGKLIVFMDPLSLVQARSAPNFTSSLQQQTSSTLGKLLDAWGLKFDTTKVVADPTYRTRINRGGQIVDEPTWLSLVGDAINKDDVATADLDELLLVAPGAITGTPVEGIHKTVLLQTSDTAGYVDKIIAQLGGDTTQNLQAEGRPLPLAIRLSGHFKTAFPNGKPATSSKNNSKEKDQKSQKSSYLKESTKESVVVLVGDTDMLFDAFALRIQRFLGQRLIAPLNGNLAFCQNLVEQLLGDTELIHIRTKAIKRRPFTVIQQMQQKAIQKYQDTIRQLENEVRETERRLNELQAQKDKSQRFILSPEQQAEIRKLQQKEAQANKRLRQVRKELVREVDSLQTRIKWLDTAGMPVVVILIGLGVAWFRRKRMVRK